jgi:short-subunit dehydrogenase
MSATAPARTALVTGASGGIGRALAEQFARAGSNLVLSARSEATLAAIAADWRTRYGISVAVFPADLSRPGAAQALFDAVSAAGIGIDDLVNNARVATYGVFAESDLDAELAMMRLNMEALVVLTHRFLPTIRARRGKILNVASTAAFQPGPYMAIYYATKAFVLLFSEALGAELAGTGVTVTALCPGPTASGFQDRAAMGASALVKGKRLPTADSVAEAGYRAFMAGTPVYIPGFANRLLAFGVRLTPRRIITAMSKRLAAPVG